MAELKCSVCEGKIIVGSGGVAVCDSCGASPSKNRIVEKMRKSETLQRVKQKKEWQERKQKLKEEKRRERNDERRRKREQREMNKQEQVVTLRCDICKGKFVINQLFTDPDTKGAKFIEGKSKGAKCWRCGAEHGEDRVNEKKVGKEKRRKILSAISVILAILAWQIAFISQPYGSTQGIVALWSAIAFLMIFFIRRYGDNEHERVLEKSSYKKIYAPEYKTISISPKFGGGYKIWLEKWIVIPFVIWGISAWVHLSQQPVFVWAYIISFASCMLALISRKKKLKVDSKRVYSAKEMYGAFQEAQQERQLDERVAAIKRAWDRA